MCSFRATVHAYANPGRYTVYVTVSDGYNTVTSDFETIVVGPAPTVRITSPAINSHFLAGDIVTFAAEAVHPEGGKVICFVS